MDLRRRWARRWIVAGFIVVAAGIFTLWISDFTEVGFGPFGLAYRIQVFVSPAGSVASAVAWWFLSALFARGVDDRRLARRALLWLAVGSALTAVVYLLELIEYESMHVVEVHVWTIFRISPSIAGLGAVIETVGFFLMMRSYSKNPRVDSALVAFDAAVNEVGNDGSEANDAS
jgi:hypothetical protein